MSSKDNRDRRDPLGFAIYRHVCRMNGKSYVGQTEYGVKRRWVQHVRVANLGSDCLLHRAIRKYGPDAFDHEVLERLPTREAANEAEARWVAHFGANVPGRGYNLDGGGGAAGGRHAETRAKIGAFHKARWAAMTPEEKSELGRRINGAMSRPKRREATLRNWAALTDEERLDQVDRLQRSRTSEQRSEDMRRYWASLSPAERLEHDRRRQSALTPEKRSAAARKRAEHLGPEGRKEVGRKIAAAWAAKSPEEQRDIVRRRQAGSTPESRHLAALKAAAAQTPEARSERTRRMNAAFTPEQRSEMARKREATKRRNRGGGAERG